MPPDTIACPSTITEVEVYARGALVTRRVQLPETLPDAPVELIIEGVTPVLQDGSLRASAQGRDVLGLRSWLHVPDGPSTPGAAAARVEALEDDARRQQALLQHTQHLVEQLRDLTPALPRPGGPRRPVDNAIEDGLAVCRLVDSHLERLEDRARAMQRRLEDTWRDLSDARLEADQTSQATLAGASHPTRAVAIRLASAREDAALDSLTFTYAIHAARWWPAYTARLSEGATRAELTLEAFVAQATLEDWGDVRVALSTADLNRDVQLPELPSLRLGRAQRAPTTGYRSPPQGLDALFEGYDRTFLDQSPLSPPEPPRDDTTGSFKAVLAEPAARGKAMKKRESSKDSAMAYDEQEEGLADAILQSESMSFGPPQSMPAPARKSASLFGGFGGGMPELARSSAPGAARPQPTTGPPPPPSPDDAWLNFDALVLPDPKAAPQRRGRLSLRVEVATLELTLTRVVVELAAEQARTIEAVPAPHLTADPRDTRGEFDHRFAAIGTIDLPGDALPRRVALQQAEAATSTRFRAVPVHEAAVWRELTLTNPFPSPLLAGPVDIFIGGALLMTSRLQAVGKGGALTVGLGVEDRLRVARNVRASEATRGMFGGTTLVEHTVTLELTSHLPSPATLDVFDRLPVYGNDDIEIREISASPVPTPYDQAERGRPIEGGRRWTLTLEPGATRKIELRYDLAFSSKYELHGGNRRD